MPADKSLTAFYTFSAGERIRSGYVNNNFSVYRGHIVPVDPTTLASPNLTYDLGGAGQSWMNIYGGVHVLTAQSTPAANPSTTTAYKMYFKSDGSLYKLNSAGTESQLGGAGGGGGISVEWVEGANSPTMIPYSTIPKTYYFEAGLGQELNCTVKVPAGYVAGSPFGVRACIFSSEATGTILLSIQATLTNSGDTIGSTTNQATSTNTAINMSGGSLSGKMQLVTFAITSNGTINSVAIGAGALITLRLFRGTDTGAADIYFIPGTEEVYTS